MEIILILANKNHNGKVENKQAEKSQNHEN